MPRPIGVPTRRDGGFLVPIMLRALWTSRRITAGAVAAAMPEGPPENYWSADADTLVQRLGSTREGLTAAEAAGRLREYGPNQVREHRRLTRTRVLVNQIRNPLLLVLVFAAVASAMTGEWVDAVIVVVIVLATVSIGYAREYQRGDGCGGPAGARAHTSPRPSRRARRRRADRRGRAGRRGAAVGRQPGSRRRRDSRGGRLLRQRSGADRRELSRRKAAGRPSRRQRACATD